MPIRLNKDFRKQIDSVFENVAIASGAKQMVRNLLRVIEEYDDNGAAIVGTWQGAPVVLVDARPAPVATPLEPPIELTPAGDLPSDAEVLGEP
jgi:hypothetical protein